MKTKNLTYDIVYRRRDGSNCVVFSGCRSIQEALDMREVKQMKYKLPLHIV